MIISTNKFGEIASEVLPLFYQSLDVVKAYQKHLATDWQQWFGRFQSPDPRISEDAAQEFLDWIKQNNIC